MVKQQAEVTNFPVIPRKQVLVELPSGEIRSEIGADGAWLVFDADCGDCLPYCKAQCCALIGTVVHPDEQQKYQYAVDWDEACKALVLHRDADGFCTYLDRPTRRCAIYDQRPQTCRDFHCSRGVGQRGWKLANHVDRQSMA